MVSSRFVRRAALVLMICVLGRSGYAGNDGPPASQSQAAPATQPQSAPASQPHERGGLLPVTVIVTDAETQKPVTDLVYSFSVTTVESREDISDRDETWRPSWPVFVPPKEKPFPSIGPRIELKDGTRVQSPTGTFQIEAPRSCLLRLRIKALDYVDGWKDGDSQRFVVRSDDKERVLAATLTPGVTVRGVVKDATTGKPIPGAEICPATPHETGGVDMLPRQTEYSADWDRRVAADQEGRFELHGITEEDDIYVRHANYLGTGIVGNILIRHDDGSADTEFSLIAGQDVRGVVKDPAGRPVEGVRVGRYTHVDSKTVATDKDGLFVLKNAMGDRADSCWIQADKDGYSIEPLDIREAAWDNVVIELKPLPQPRIGGQVLDEGGRPIRKFLVAVVSKDEPSSWYQKYDVEDADGRFSVPFREEGLLWLGIQADGYASWETRRDTKQTTDPLVVRLGRGCSVRGKVTLPDRSAGPLKIMLLPPASPKADRLGQMTAKQLLAVARGTVNADGEIRLEHVRPGGYLLYVYGPGVTPMERWLDVQGTEVDLGTLQLEGTGTIVGRYRVTGSDDPDESAFHPGNVGYSDEDPYFSLWRKYTPLSNVRFRTDENGRFRVEGVPIGWVKASINSDTGHGRPSGDVRLVRVAQGATTEVRFADPNREWDLPVCIIVGDGSRAHWESGTACGSDFAFENSDERDPVMELSLEPTTETRCSFLERQSDRVSRATEWVIPDVHPGRYRLGVALGWRKDDLCWQQDIEARPNREPVKISLDAGSVTGKIRQGGAVWMMSEDRKFRVRTSWCDGGNWFAFRFVQPGSYYCYAHSHRKGWCRIGPVKVNNDMVDIGTHELQPGGTIAGQVKPVSGKRLPTELHATDTQGVIIDHPKERFDAIDGQPFTFEHLWPGEWTVTLLAANKDVLAEGKVTVKTGETAHVDLVWK